jgi:polar amino acid transport system substrate-binding protein
MNSTKNTARLSGLLWFLSAVTGGLGLFYVRSNVIVVGDAAATAANIVASEFLFRAAIVSSLFSQIFLFFVGLTLFHLFKEVNKVLATVCLTSAMMTVAIAVVNVLNLFGALLVSSQADYLKVFNPEQLNAMAMIFLRLANSFGQGLLEIFWTPYYFSFGLLIVRSSSPHNVIRDSGSGEMKGVAFDLGKELARRVGVPFEPVLYPSVGALLDGGKSGAWDVAFVGFSPARAKEWDFTALHLEIEFGYLVPGGSSISSMADVDRPGIRVAVQEKSQPDVFLTRTLKNAEVVRASSLAGTLEMLKSGRADVIFSIKPSLFEASNQLPGSRVLDGRLGLDPHAMAIPKGRDLGVPYARRFIEDAKSEGLVKAAIERAGIRGAVVAPLE